MSRSGEQAIMQADSISIRRTTLRMCLAGRRKRDLRCGNLLGPTKVASDTQEHGARALSSDPAYD